MVLKELGLKVDKTHDDLLILQGQVDTLTKLVGVYQSQASKLEGRLWGALTMSIGAMATAILTFIFRK